MTAQELAKVVVRHAGTLEDLLEDLRKDVTHLEIACNNYRFRIEDLEAEVKMLRSEVDRFYYLKKER